jgi:two-component system cell cycle sensor histidine kinase/response regulator CckA
MEGTVIRRELTVNTLKRDVTERKRTEEQIRENNRKETEITERRQVEENLRATSLYARSLIEASLDPLVTISAEGKITDVNKATELVTGYKRDQLIGSDFSNYFTEPEKAREGYQQVFTEGFVRDYPLAIRHKSGGITDVLYNATVYRNESGDIQGVFAAARDITIRKQAEMQIREQAELIDKAHDAITVQDLNDHITFWNKGAQRVYGWTSEEATGKKANELFYKGEMIRFYEARETVIERGEWSGEWHHNTKDGREIIVESHWTLMRDDEGKPKSILCINTDITDRKRLEEQMLRAQRMESVGTLAGGIAHDLNNILTPIMLSLQLLRTKLQDEDSKEMLDILEKSAHRGTDLVRQVLTFARGVEGERKPIQITNIIAEVERIIRETFPKSIELRREISSDLWPISGDATQLHQVIMNLVLNSRDAMPDGGVLDISADNIFIDEDYTRIHMDAKVGRYIVISVSDNGAGIPSEFRDKIFEPFFTTKERGKGTGLGLSTALAIVKSHGGFINMYSEVGKGSIFKVYLPVTAVEMGKVETVPSERVKGKGELILVVEDETSICDITRRILESNGYKAIIANNGADGVALYAKSEEKVAVVLMDMAMPIMDGSMCIRALHKIDPKVKIIAVSGLTENGKVGNIAALVNAFLAKPYTADGLLKVIDEVLNKK